MKWGAKQPTLTWIMSSCLTVVGTRFIQASENHSKHSLLVPCRWWKGNGVPGSESHCRIPSPAFIFTQFTELDPFLCKAWKWLMFVSSSYNTYFSKYKAFFAELYCQCCLKLTGFGISTHNAHLAWVGHDAFPLQSHPDLCHHATTILLQSTSSNVDLLSLTRSQY